MADDDPVEDASREYPVACVLRPPLRAVVDAFRRGDYRISAGIPLVESIGPETARQISEYVRDYGETLVSLPEETWSTSVARWMDGHWDMMVDLWTEESGRSDMILAARVRRRGPDYTIEITSVHVP